MNIIAALFKRIRFKMRMRDTLLITHKYPNGHTKSRLVSVKDWMVDTKWAFDRGVPVNHKLEWD